MSSNVEIQRNGVLKYCGLFCKGREIDPVNARDVIHWPWKQGGWSRHLEHLKFLEEVFSRIAKARLIVKKNKCKSLVPSVSYLGYIIDANGVRPLPE